MRLEGWGELMIEAVLRGDLMIMTVLWSELMIMTVSTQGGAAWVEADRRGFQGHDWGLC